VETVYPNEWEVLTDAEGNVVVVICEDCITSEEQQAIDDADMALDVEVSGVAGHCACCFRAVPYEGDDPGEPLPVGWEVLDSDAAVDTPGCFWSYAGTANSG
jgi:hypothetical protein